MSNFRAGKQEITLWFVNSGRPLQKAAAILGLCVYQLGLNVVTYFLARILASFPAGGQLRAICLGRVWFNGNLNGNNYSFCGGDGHGANTHLSSQ